MHRIHYSHGSDLNNVDHFVTGLQNMNRSTDAEQDGANGFCITKTGNQFISDIGRLK